MNIPKIVGSIFSITSSALFVGAGITYTQSRKFIDHSTGAKGVVVDLSLSRSSSSSTPGSVYYPIVRFKTAKGEEVEFRGDVGSNPPSYRKGEEVQVRYDPKDPYHASIDSFFALWFFPLLLSGMGVIFGILGGIFLLIPVFSNRKEKWIQENGQLIATEFQSVEQNKSETIGGQHPYQIISQWLDSRTNKVYVFRSRNISFNPEKFIQRKEIQVRIDPDNPKKYSMDISFLPEDAN